MSKWQSERSIHEMLKDTPPLRESSDSITAGTEASFPASRSMPFTPAHADAQNGTTPGTSTLLRSSSSKLESLKSWGVSTYKCTKQILYEKLGKSSRTVDTELESAIEALRETQRKYHGVLRLSSALAAQLGAAQRTQRALGEAFAELAHKSPELRDQFLYNADTQRSLARNGDALLAALHFFNGSLHTLTDRAIEDTLLTARQYEAARVEYDAYRSEVEALGGGAGGALAADVRRRWDHYERLRADAAVKLQLLHQNRARMAAPPPGARSPAPLAGQGDEQAAAAVPQRGVGLLQWQPRGAGGGGAPLQRAARAPARRRGAPAAARALGAPAARAALVAPRRPVHAFPFRFRSRQVAGRGLRSDSLAGRERCRSSRRIGPYLVTR